MAPRALSRVRRSTVQEIAMLFVHALLLTLVGFGQDPAPTPTGPSAPLVEFMQRSAARQSARSRFEALAVPRQTPQPGRLGVELVPRAGQVGIGRVVEGSAAARAALRAGDVIVSVEGRRVTTVDQLVPAVRSHGAGREIQLRIRRSVVVALDPSKRTPDGRPALGLYLGDGQDELLVTRVEPDYPAAQSDLRAGDRVVSLGGRPLSSYADLVARMRETDPSQACELGIERDVRARLDAAEESAGLDVPTMEGWERRLAQPAVPELAPPRRSAEAASQLERELAAEVRALTDDLRALREELARLRDELPVRRRRR